MIIIARHLCTQPLTGGLINQLICCHLVSDVDKTEALVVRVFAGVSEDVSDRTKELLGLQIAQATGNPSSPPLNTYIEDGVQSTGNPSLPHYSTLT